MADYETLIDAQTWAFIRRTEACYPADQSGFAIADHRRVYDAMAAVFHQEHPAGVRATDMDFGGVACRLYETAGEARGTIVYFHGGGFVLGGLESHDDVCAEICDGTGARVVSVDYRLCPEFRHPVQYQDCRDAAQAVQARFGGPLVLVGDSAGGNLAAAVSHGARGTDMQIAGQILIYPGLGGDPDSGSYIEHANAPMLTRDEIVFYKHVRFHGDEPHLDPTYAPLRDADFSGLPPTRVFSAECDPLCDDGSAYCVRIRGAGGDAVSVTEPGLVHGYLRARTSVDRARNSFERIVGAISGLI